MPCYEVAEMSVEMKAANRELLEKALKELKLQYVRSGQSFTIYAAGGSIVIGTSETARLVGNNSAALQKQLNAIKVGYSQQVLKQVAQKGRWVNRYKNAEQTKGVFIKR